MLCVLHTLGIFISLLGIRIAKDKSKGKTIDADNPTINDAEVDCVSDKIQEQLVANESERPPAIVEDVINRKIPTDIGICDVWGTKEEFQIYFKMMSLKAAFF